jgi:RHS repeat-associated protein
MLNAGKLLLIVIILTFTAIQAWAGATTANDPNANSPNDSSDGCLCGSSKANGPQASSSKGMAVYSFKSLQASLSISDTPEGYIPPVGPEIQTTITYNEREADQPTTFDSFNVGKKWTLNWLTWIQDNPTNLGNQVLRYVAGGGGRPYSGYNSTTKTFTPEGDNGALLIITSTNPITYELLFADGSMDVFSASDGKTSYPRKVFLTKIVDPQGNTVTLSYDASLRLTKVTDVIGQQTTFQYTNATYPLLVTGITDPFGRNAALVYDSSGRLTSITDTIGMTSTFAYDSGTFINTMTTPYGTSTFAHTEGANGSSVELSIQATDPDGHTERTEYLPLAPGIPASISQSRVPIGMNTSDQYLNYRDSFYWDKETFATACSISGGVTTCDYTKARMKHFLHEYPCCTYTSRILQNVKYPLEDFIWYDYVGQPAPGYPGTLEKPSHVGRVLANGTTQLTSYTYNAYAMVTKKVDPDGRETDYTYASNGIDLIEVQQKNGSGYDTLAQYTYNSQHEPLTYTNPAGETTNYMYNARGQLTSITDPLNETTSYTYNGNGYLMAVTNALGHVQHSYTYDAYGRVATDTDSQGYTRSYAYDALDRLTQITYPDATTTKYMWNKLDIASVTDRQGNTTSYVYDAERDLISVTDPLSRTTSYSYYPNGQLNTLTDPKGNVTTWSRDLESHITAETYTPPVGSTVPGFTYSYDNADRLTSATDALGQTKSYSYDTADLLTGISYQNAINSTAAVNYTYDAYYPRIVSMTDGVGSTSFSYVPVGSSGALQLASSSGPLSGLSAGYSYDALGRVFVMTYGTGGSQSFSYDPLGRMSIDSNSLGSFGYTYLGDTDQVATRSLTECVNHNCVSGFSLQYNYDGNTNDRQLQSLQYFAPNAQTPLRELDFTHSPEHLVQSRSDSTGASVLQQANYIYDQSYRLTQVRATAPPSSTATYDYDNADNLTGYQIVNGNSLTAAVNFLNELTTVNGQNWQYDAAGELLNDTVNQYTWDAEHRLIEIQNIATGHVSLFQYDGLDRRLVIIEQNANGGGVVTRHYQWCGPSLCQAQDGSGLFIAGYYPEGELQGTQSLFYVQDQIGSVIGTLDVNGNILGTTLYDAYGNAISASGPATDFGYAGMLHHAQTGFYLTQYREYNPIVGRWLSRDPIGLAGGINTYTYALNDSVGNIDPTGLKPGDDFLSPEAAAIDAIKYINPTSICENKEYAGYVYKEWSWGRSGPPTYTYDQPTQLGAEGGTMPYEPMFHETVGAYHTHAAYDPLYDNENFSPADKAMGDYFGFPTYLGTPSGKIKQYMPDPNKQENGAVNIVGSTKTCGCGHL